MNRFVSFPGFVLNACIVVDANLYGYLRHAHYFTTDCMHNDRCHRHAKLYFSITFATISLTTLYISII
jgi:hypothetical protein